MQRELLLLREMRDAAVSIRDLISGRNAEQIELDSAAAPWHFTVLGEAASQVPVEIKGAHPQIAWSAATRLRNRIVHGYWDIDVETLVATAIDDLPQMIAQLEDALSTLLAAEDHDPPA